jgi:hypothetical protein
MNPSAYEARRRWREGNGRAGRGGKRRREEEEGRGGGKRRRETPAC